MSASSASKTYSTGDAQPVPPDHTPRGGKFLGCSKPTPGELARVPPTAKLVFGLLSRGDSRCADHRGRTSIRLPTLARILRRSLRSIQRAWTWLLMAGMVEVLGRGRKKSTPRGDRRRNWTVYRVRGEAFSPGPLNRSRWKIPLRSREILQHLADSRRGGVRPGGGRPRRDLGVTDHELLAMVERLGTAAAAARELGVPRQAVSDRLRLLRVGAGNQTAEVPSDEPAGNQTEARETEDGARGTKDDARETKVCDASPGPDLGKQARETPGSIGDVDSSSSFPTEKKSEGAAGGGGSDLLVSDGEEKPIERPRRRRRSEEPSSPAPDVFEGEEVDLSIPPPPPGSPAREDRPAVTVPRPTALPEGTSAMFSGRRSAPPGPHSTGSFEVPPFPGFGLIPEVVVPKPPLLDPELDARGRVDALLDAYRSAAGAIYGTRVWAPRVSPGGKHWDLLVEAAEALIEEEIPPVAWVAWSIQRVWQQYSKQSKPRPRGGKPKPAPLQFVFGASRIAQRAGWFGSEMGDYGGGRTLMSDVHRKLMGLWHSATAEIRRLGLRDEAARQAWERWFPNGSYERGLKKAQDEAARMADEMTRALDDGKYLWL